ncbi:hypothetical protein ACBY01_12965 [Sphingomonas sp. ac-8]|uniref:hypothetical protein n=1 Tax=Sphingomonas sp. ac-8 TaxID=3242977 RepID=UPI003A804C18
MLHRHAFATSPRTRFLPRVPDAQPLTPEGYLRLRRKAVGLDIRDLAARLTDLCTALVGAGELSADMLAAREDFVSILIMLEAPGVRARRRETLEAIAAVMPFDADVYQQLADADPRRHPRVCRGCGTSTQDHDMPSWATTTSCTRCDPAGEGL